MRWAAGVAVAASASGIQERGEHNNHGTSYDVQVAAFSLFCGRREQAVKALDGRSIRKAIEWMIPCWREEREWKWPQITKFDELRIRWPLAVYERFASH